MNARTLASVPLALLIFVSACKEKEQRAGEMSRIDALPQCSIEAVKSCEPESKTATETIYRCPACGAVEQCPYCLDHDCTSCTSEACRCRHAAHGSEPTLP